MNSKDSQFLVVNAFATAPFGGNPAAVFTYAEELDDFLMLAVARQLNLVETVFVFPCEDDHADFRLRYFTPQGEIPVAGHPSIAAWLALAHEELIDLDVKTRFTQKNLAGYQQIEFDLADRNNPVVRMKQPPAQFLDAQFDPNQVAEVFGIEAQEIEPSLPIKAVHTGLGHIIVPISSLNALFKVEREIEPLARLCESAGVREAQLFCFETVDEAYAIHTRNICPREGLEDPACGIGNGALTAYLSRYHYPSKNEFKLKIEQGYVVEMPSIVHTHATKSGKELDVWVGGTGIVMLEGEFLV